MAMTAIDFPVNCIDAVFAELITAPSSGPTVEWESIAARAPLPDYDREAVSEPASDAPVAEICSELEASSGGREIHVAAVESAWGNGQHEREVVRAAQAGNEEAFDLLYKRYLPRVKTRLLAALPHADAEDVAQEVFLAAVRSLPRFDARSSFGTWLTAIANHKIVDYYRRRPKLETVSLGWAARTGEADGCAGAAAYEQIVEETGDPVDRLVVRAALARLPKHYREVLLLRAAEDLGFGQIAMRLDLSEEAARSLFRRAVAACKQIFSEPAAGFKDRSGRAA